MEDAIIRELKPLIDNGNLDSIKTQWREFQEETEFDRPVAWDYVFQKIYIHACLKKQSDIAKWLEEDIFKLFNPIIQVAIRHTFNYGRHLLRK